MHVYFHSTKKEISTFSQAGVVFESCALNFLFNSFNLLQNLIHSVHAIRTLKGTASCFSPMIYQNLILCLKYNSVSSNLKFFLEIALK